MVALYEAAKEIIDLLTLLKPALAPYVSMRVETFLITIV